MTPQERKMIERAAHRVTERAVELAGFQEIEKPYVADFVDHVLRTAHINWAADLAAKQQKARMH